MNCSVESNKKGEKHMNWLIWEGPHVINMYQTLEPHVSTCIKPSTSKVINLLIGMRGPSRCLLEHQHHC